MLSKWLVEILLHCTVVIAEVTQQAGVGAKKRGLKVDLKLDLHPSLHQSSLADLLKLSSTALQVQLRTPIRPAQCLSLALSDVAKNDN